jgi:mono/diheme cytochrome c family protein
LTEVPEHLLQRSRERRAALGLGGGEEGGAPAAAAAPAAAPAADTPAEDPGSVVPAAAAAAPAVAEPLPVYVAPPQPPKRIPVWMTPVLLLLPVWAFIYLGTFGERGGEELTPLQLGERVYNNSGCAGCHGATGGGGVGPALAGDDAEKTFPEEADHIAWIENGSAASKGQPYGDPNREGGQRVATSGAMPAFEGVLTPEEISAVVLYEREGL